MKRHFSTAALASLFLFPPAGPAGAGDPRPVPAPRDRIVLTVCPPLAHRPDADVAYRPGVTADGDRVAPADLAPEGPIARRVADWNRPGGVVGFDLWVDPQGRVRLGLSDGGTQGDAPGDRATVHPRLEGRLDLGRVEIDPVTGHVTLNGEPLSPEAAVRRWPCPEGTPPRRP